MKEIQNNWNHWRPRKYDWRGSILKSAVLMGWLFFKQRPQEYVSLRGAVGRCFPKSPSAGAPICHLRDENRQWTYSFCHIPYRHHHTPTHARTIRSTPTSAWASLVAQMVKNLPAMRRPGFSPWVGKILWRRSWQPTPVFLPGEFHGQRSLEGYSARGHKELDTIEQLTLTFQHPVLKPRCPRTQCQPLHLEGSSSSRGDRG